MGNKLNRFLRGILSEEEFSGHMAGLQFRSAYNELGKRRAAIALSRPKMPIAPEESQSTKVSTTAPGDESMEAYREALRVGHPVVDDSGLTEVEIKALEDDIRATAPTGPARAEEPPAPALAPAKGMKSPKPPKPPGLATDEDGKPFPPAVDRRSGAGSHVSGLDMALDKPVRSGKVKTEKVD